MRLFVALPIPDVVARPLMLLQGGVPGARWQTREQLHLTLSFIGEVEGDVARMIDDALAGIDAPAFDLQLHGVGQFGPGVSVGDHVAGDGQVGDGGGPACEFGFVGSAAEGADEHRFDTFGGRPAVVLHQLIGPCLRGLYDERVIEQDQGLGRDVGDIAFSRRVLGPDACPEP